MTPTITACTDLRSPCTFVAKAEVCRWEEDFGVAVDWRPCTTPLKEAFGASLYESGVSVLVLPTK